MILEQWKDVGSTQRRKMKCVLYMDQFSTLNANIQSRHVLIEVKRMSKKGDTVEHRHYSRDYQELFLNIRILLHHQAKEKNTVIHFISPLNCKHEYTIICICL